MKERTYIAIDLKSFYASVECRLRNLDPLDACLVVADETRSDRTICLAVSPPLKSFGVPGRERLFAVRQVVDAVNRKRRMDNGGHLSEKSTSLKELSERKDLALDFVVAPPQMALYIKVSSQIYNIYLKYVSPDDIHVYSIDEVFIDVTDYLATYRTDARTLAMRMILDVLSQTGITATAGIGSNLYLAKVSMDIMAKHIKADENGVRIACLDEMEYRKRLWNHEPLTDFWRVGPGYRKKLEANGMRTMGDIALQSVRNEDLLYSLFGVNAELLIDHAWGFESCTMKDIKAYRPSDSSLGQGQVLMEPYSAPKARLVLFEMADALSLSLLAKGLAASQIVVSVGFDRQNLTMGYKGQTRLDHYGRTVPTSVNGRRNLKRPSCLASDLASAALDIFDTLVDPALLVRRLNITACHLCLAEEADSWKEEEQLDLFSDTESIKKEEEDIAREREKEMRMQKATLSIKEKFGKNAILRLSSFEEGATARDRNRQIGGHRA